MIRRPWFIALFLPAVAVLSCRSNKSPSSASPEARPVSAAAASPAAVPAEGQEMLPQPKRVGPPEVEPVRIGERLYRVVPWGRERGWKHNGGYIAAYDTSGKRELWTLEVYDVPYDPKLEEDVQDVFIKKMAAGPGPDQLTVVDERDRAYRVDVRARRATAVAASPPR
jgi:hypothetical protein